MSQYRIYESPRGHPLLYWGEPPSCAILTAENYDKWYELYLIHPDGKITEVEADDVLEIAAKDFDANWMDHLYSPRLLYLLAEHLGATLCDRLQEVAIGRWLLEGPDDGKAARELKLTEPDA